MDAGALKFLEHLTYVLECLAEDLKGEAKYELSRLIDEYPGYYALEAENVEKLAEALELLHQDKARHAASHLSFVSRQLWKAVANTPEDPDAANEA